MGAASLAFSLGTDPGEHERSLIECWHISLGLANTLANIDDRDPEMVLSLVRICERVARTTARHAAAQTSSPSRWIRCRVLAELCAEHCGKLAGWLDTPRSLDRASVSAE